jgi:RNA polymerase sigma-70 factor (ECF subfamily)
VRDHEGSGEVLSDEELVERGRAGDDAALSELVERHHAAAYRVAFSMLQEDDAAQDVVQDAFIKAFRALAGFRGEASFRTWILTIAGNEARSALRRRGRRRETALEDAGPVRSQQKPPDMEAVDAQEAAWARKMMETLPEKQKLSVALRIEEGLSFKEIGEIIGSSEGAARVNYFHGIRRLRELLQ